MAHGWHYYRLVPMFVVMGTIFFLSHQPGDTFELPEVVNIDKILHMLVYGILAATALFALPGKMIRQNPCRIGMLVILFCFAYGLSDEWHQSFIPGRFPSAWDVAADTIGAVIVVSLWLKLSGVSCKRSLLHHS